LIIKLRKNLLIQNAKKNIPFVLHESFLSKFKSKYLNDSWALVKKRKGRGYRFNKYRYATHNRLFPKNIIIAKELKAIKDFAKSKKAKKLNVSRKTIINPMQRWKAGLSRGRNKRSKKLLKKNVKKFNSFRVQSHPAAIKPLWVAKKIVKSEIDWLQLIINSHSRRMGTSSINGGKKKVCRKL